jgi:hypothetical protein
VPIASNTCQRNIYIIPRHTKINVNDSSPSPDVYIKRLSPTLYLLLADFILSYPITSHPLYSPLAYSLLFALFAASASTFDLIELWASSFQYEPVMLGRNFPTFCW